MNYEKLFWIILILAVAAIFVLIIAVYVEKKYYKDLAKRHNQIVDELQTALLENKEYRESINKFDFIRSSLEYQVDEKDKIILAQDEEIGSLKHTYNQIFDSYKEELESHEQTSSAKIIAEAKLSAAEQKMATAYVVHQVIIRGNGKHVLCLAEVIYADSMSEAFAEFVIKRNKRLKDNKINPAKCGHIQVHRVWKDTTTEPHQNL